MAKRVPAQERRTATVIAMVPLRIREAVERIARRERVSLSEIARRAVTQFVETHGSTR